LGDSEINHLIFHPIIGLGFKPADSITGYNSAKLESIKKRLFLAFFKQSNSFCISFSITFLSELNPFPSLLDIDHITLLYDLRRYLFTGYPGVFCDLNMRIFIFGLGTGFNACKGTFYKLTYFYT
jgi:hypothetical protein